MDFLLELLSEEIPARMQDKASADLARLFAEEIARAGLAAAVLQTYATPRRLALIARGLPDAAEAASEEIKGPRVSAPPQALEGFLRKTGLTLDQLVERDGVLFAVLARPGRATADVLAEAIPSVVRAFPWPKSMRWGAGSLRWVRPLQGIVALLGDEVVPFEIEGIVSGAATAGHRFHHPGIVTIGNADDYAAKLRACHVILDPEERRAIILERAEALAAEAGLSLAADEGLVAENAGLTEWPVPLLGRFDPAFLEVPREVIQLTMRTNQKYFALTRADGSLAPNFICTANIEAADGGAAIAAGNARVLSARLSDARFFWEQDRKVPLEEQAKKLAGIVFHEKLGTVADKVERVAKLARWLVEEGIIKPSPLQGRGLGEGAASPASLSVHSPLTPALSPEGEREQLADMAEQAARLCKADLVTAMVGEFPELQGVMGGHYARAEGYPPEVADAIRDHYKPVGSGDEVPTAPVTVAVSLADKLDSVFAFLGVNEPPTGSRDPFALRRQILGVISQVLDTSTRVSLNNACTVLGILHQETYAEIMSEDVPALGNHLTEYRGLGLPMNIDRFQIISEITPRAMDLFIADIPKHGDDAYNQLNQGHRLGAMHRSASSRHLWFVDLAQLSKASKALIAFVGDRLKVQQREAGVRQDLIDAVFGLGGEDDLVRLLARVKALQAFVATEEGANLLAGYRRAANILRAEEKKGGSPPDASGERAVAVPYIAEPAEAALASALDSAIPAAASAVEREDFGAAMSALAALRSPIDRFFDEVTVNDTDPARRANRLALLEKIRAAVHKVADFSKIEG